MKEEPRRALLRHVEREGRDDDEPVISLDDSGHWDVVTKREDYDDEHVGRGGWHVIEAEQIERERREVETRWARHNHDRKRR